MNLFVVDVEADGPCPGLYSMVSFGIVQVSADPAAELKSFYGKTAPISERWIPDALAVSGFSREDHLGFESPDKVMHDMARWLEACTPEQPVFLSDNPAFDWQFINYYCHAYLGANPFGHSARRIGDLYCGAVKHWRANRDWKSMRKTKHTHNPVDDARGNAEAFTAFVKKLQIRKVFD